MVVFYVSFVNKDYPEGIGRKSNLSRVKGSVLEISPQVPQDVQAVALLGIGGSNKNTKTYKL